MTETQNKSKKKSSKFLLQMKKMLFLVPQIEAPPISEKEQIDLQDKMLWTFGCLVIYLILCGTPLYGVRLKTLTSHADPLHWFRPMLASRSGTLMELGISPIVTSGLVLQLLAGSRMINYYGADKDYKALFQAVQKLVAIIIIIGEAIAFIASGIYGDWYYDLGIIGCILIFLQLFCGSLCLILLDEIIQRGYGIGNGVSLFIATNICTNIIWKTLSPTTIDTASGIQYEGALVALFHLLLTRKSIVPALKEAFYRSNLPNISNLFSTILMFLIVIYFQGFRIDLPVKSTKLRGTQGQTKYPIKLFYTSNIPIILHTAFVSNICFFSQFLSIRFGNNVITNLFGKWQHIDVHNNNLNYIDSNTNMDYNNNVAIGGLVYYILPPNTMYSLLSDPIHSVIYLVFILSTCAVFSATYIAVSGSAPKDVAKQLKDQGLVIRGYREQSTHQVLQRYIPAAALSGGVTIAALSIIADCCGCIGSGASVLLAVTIIFEIFETYVREAQAQGLNLNMLAPNMAL